MTLPESNEPASALSESAATLSDVLKKFTEKNKTTFRPLSDNDSSRIKAYGVLNERAKGNSGRISDLGVVHVGKDLKVSSLIASTVLGRHTTRDLVDAANKLD